MCPRDGEEHRQTLHRNHLLPISPNLEQAEDDAPVAGVEETRTSAPMSSVDSEPPDSELSWMTTPGTMGDMSQDSLDPPASLRCGTCATWNQLPWRYHNYALLADTSQPRILEAWVGL